MESGFNSSHPFFQLIAESLNSESELVLRSNHPFYPLANFVQQLNLPNPPNVNSVADIQNIYKTTFAQVRKIHWTSLDLQELEKYIEFIEKKMGEFAEKKNSHFNYQRVLRLILLVFQDIYASSNVKGNKRHFKTKMEEKICELLTSLSVFYRTHEVDLQLAESYGREALGMLQEAPDQCGKKVKNIKFLVQMNLALIYLKLGYTESALKILNKASANQVYDIDCLDQFLLMLEGYQAVIEYFQTRSLTFAILLCRDLMSFKTVYAKGIAQDRILERITRFQYDAFLVAYLEIDKKSPALVLKTQQGYKDKLFQDVRQNQNCRVVENIEFDAEDYKIKLKFSDDIDNSIIQRAMKIKNINFKMYTKNEVTWYIFDIDALTSQNLRKVCLCIGKIRQNEVKKLEEDNRRRAIKENSAEEVNFISGVESHDTSIQASDSESYKAPLFFKENKPSMPLAPKPKNTQKKPSSKSTNPVNQGDTKKVITPVKYTWEGAGVWYSSANKQCFIKPLVSNYDSGDLWYGYIPKWIFQDSRFNPEFSNRLARGAIKKDCIRDITKELLTFNDQNFSEKYPYKFKIVVPNGNLRLYGWIDDKCIDQEGKVHYLVCFGFIADHETRFLSNPETLKRKNEVVVSPKSIR